MRTLYTSLLFLILPLVLLRLLWRSRRAPAYRRRWRERLGLFERAPAAGGIWIHAVSVGETQAIAPLVRRLLHEHEDLPVTITTTTPTGSDQVRRLFGDDVFHVYMPYDLPVFLRRFLDRVQPSVLLMVETEIWPNLLHECRQRGIHSLLANARMSQRSMQRYLRFSGFAQQVFAAIDVVAAQSPDDAERFARIGVPQAALKVTGSIKFDLEMPASVEEHAEVVRHGWQGRPVWIAASTHQGEEEQVLAAHQLLLRALPQALLILVPRHPERFDKVAGQIRRSGLSFCRRSQNQLPEAADSVYLCDTMGELPVFLGASDVAFIGGSLVPIGGHNMLEAAAHGVPVCMGPHTHNFAYISELLLADGAARRVSNSQELAELMQSWLSDASVRAAAGEAGRQLVQAHKGALQRLYDALQALLP